HGGVDSRRETTIMSEILPGYNLRPNNKESPLSPGDDVSSLSGGGELDIRQEVNRLGGAVQDPDVRAEPAAGTTEGALMECTVPTLSQAPGSSAVPDVSPSAGVTIPPSPREFAPMPPKEHTNADATAVAAAEEGIMMEVGAGHTLECGRKGEFGNRGKGEAAQPSLPNDPKPGFLRPSDGASAVRDTIGGDVGPSSGGGKEGKTHGDNSHSEGNVGGGIGDGKTGTRGQDRVEGVGGHAARSGALSERSLGMSPRHIREGGDLRSSFLDAIQNTMAHTAPLGTPQIAPDDSSSDSGAESPLQPVMPRRPRRGSTILRAEQAALSVSGRSSPSSIHSKTSHHLQGGG
ncbi:unnamed protein product, partial [Discosporangium mesarthrocarpum]